MAAKHRKVVKKRTEWLFVIFVLLYALIVGRLFNIQVMNNDRYCKLAKEIRQRNRKIPASRGLVFDRAGRQLITNLPSCDVYVQPKRIDKVDQISSQLAAILGIDESKVREEIESSKTFRYVCRNTSRSIGDQVRKANLIGVGVEYHTKRVYAAGGLASHILGFTSIDGKGSDGEGIERAADKYLTGEDGYTEAEVDPHNRVIPDTRVRSVDPVDGADVTLTIDSYLQHIAEVALKNTFKKFKAVGATAIVMDPDTGEILALANCPTFDANNRKGVPIEAFRNRAVTDLYEPGSTFKLFTTSAGIEEGMSPTVPVATCIREGMQIGKRRVRCTLHAPYQAGHGAVNMFGIIRDSCNVGAASIALHLGADKMDSYLKSFGLLDRPGSGLIGEARFGLGAPENWSSIRLANIGFGQGVSVSGLQMACAYGAIANGGNLMRPQIIREVRGSDSRVIKSFKPIVVRRVVSKSTADKAIEMLMGCVDEGTGKTARVEGYSVAGKTGSAQKAGKHGYVPGKFIASFMGFVPAKDPRLVVCVIVDEPKGSHWGATVAGPVFQEIAQKSLLYLKVPPDMPITPSGVPINGSAKLKSYLNKLGAGHTG